MKSSRPSPGDDAGALVEAERLAAAGHRLDAIRSLSAANRVCRSAAIEARLIALRHEAFDDVDATRGHDEWPPSAVDVFEGAPGVPEIAAIDLTPEAVTSGITRHGALIARGLLRPEHIDRLTADIDEAFAAYDLFQSGASVAETAPWFVPFEGGDGASVAPVRKWVHGGGGVLAVESPRTAFDVLETFAAIDLAAPLAAYLREPLVLSAKKWTLRRVPIDSSTNWHQDGAFLGRGIRAVNVWITLTDCGDDAPGLEMVPRRFDVVLPTGTEGAVFPTSIGPPVVARAAETAPVYRPLFAAGDAMFFDDLFLHRTAVGGAMRRERYAIESWFFAPSHYPREQIPIVV